MDAALRTLLSCPACGVELSSNGDRLGCSTCGESYGSSRGRPVLIRSANEMFSPSDFPDDANGARGRRWMPKSLSVSPNLSRSRSLRRLAALAPEASPILIIGSGDQRKAVEAELGPRSIVIATDVALDADVDVFADGHELPFRDATFGAVIATAVLEHVADPERVMQEIVRVTTAGGLLYSEVPFMQQVHEGPHDFTRFTLGGHRRLTNRYDLIDSGAVAGPMTALVWAVEHLGLSLGGWRRPRLTKAIIRIAFGWLTRIDSVIAQRPAALDAASCTFVLGRLRSNGSVSDAQIVQEYRGAQPPARG